MESIGAFLPLILIFGVFYILLIRPQQKKVKAHREMLNNLRRGDKIITSGGIIGTVNKVADNRELQVQVSENVEIKIAPGMVADLYTSTAATPEDEISPKSNDLPPTHKGGTVGIDLPLRVTKLNSGPNPLIVTDVLSPLSLLVVTPTSLDSASAIFLSANLPISSAVIASTTPTFSLLIDIASIKLDLIPVVTTSSTSALSASSASSAKVKVDKGNKTIKDNKYLFTDFPLKN